MNESLISLVKNYSISDEVVQRLRPISTVILTGITGAGKDTIINDIVERSTQFEKLVTTTTRQPRVNNGIPETHGREYYFLSLDEAEQAIRDHKYIEVAVVHDRINGSLISEFERIADQDKVALTDIDYQGASHFLDFGMKNLAVYFITPPSFEIYIARLLKRQGGVVTGHEELLNRFRSAQKELSYALTQPQFIPLLNDVSTDTAEAIIRYTREETRPSEEEQERTREVISKLHEGITNYIKQLEETL